MGSLDKKVNDIIKDNHLENKVIYHGPKQIEETVRYYKNADALIVGLDNKGTVGKTIPNKLSQYLYFKKPILGVLEGDGKDLLTKTGGALLTANDIDSISKGMLDIIHLNEKTKLEMGKKNKEYYEKNLTIQEITRSILNHLK